MVAVELIDNHQRVDVAEGDETEGKDAQGADTFGNETRFVGTEKAGDVLGEEPDGGAGDEHRRRDETERLADDELERLVVSLAHLDGTQRLDGATGAGEEEIVDIQDVHADGEGEDARAAQRGEDNVVGAQQQGGKADGRQGERGALGDNLLKGSSERLFPSQHQPEVVAGVPEVPAHDGNADEVADDGGRRRTLDAPAQPLDEDDVAQQVDGIVDEDGDGNEPRTPIDPDHVGHCPRHHKGRRTKKHGVKIVAQAAGKLLVRAQHTRDGIVAEHTAEGHQQAESQTAHGGEGEDAGRPRIVLLAELHAHEHTRARREQHADREHELRDRLRQVDGTDAVLADEVTHDD